ncbi:MAG: hypothetical protein JOZ48_03180 [Acidobacteriaceae bacterium]|nr:hypothetical protein [Acidobacteriaceae bacterium]
MLPECDRQALPIWIVFTTTNGALAALARAGELAASLDAQIRIVLPHVVPYPLPLNRPAVDPLFRVKDFCDMCEKRAIEIEIEVRLCRDAHECLRDWLPPNSLVVIGCRKNRFGRENRLGRTLRRLGHHVIFVAIENGEALDRRSSGILIPSSSRI